MVYFGTMKLMTGDTATAERAFSEAMKIAAKPASTVVRVSALKALKDTIG